MRQRERERQDEKERERQDETIQDIRERVFIKQLLPWVGTTAKSNASQIFFFLETHTQSAELKTTQARSPEDVLVKKKIIFFFFFTSEAGKAISRMQRNRNELRSSTALCHS